MVLAVICILFLTDILKSQGQIFRSPCKKDATFKLVQKDARLDASVLESKKLNSLSNCAKLCVDSQKCNSINYNPKTTFCEVLSQTRSAAGEGKLIINAGWKHYEPIEYQVTPVCRIKGDPCGTFEKCVDDCSKEARYRCDALQNIARGKTTANEPNFPGRPPWRAVDGNTNTHWSGGSCTHTTCCSPMPWWRVDFGKTALVYAMKITNRGDCCGNRLSNFNIRIGDSSQGRGDLNTACKSSVGVGQGATATFVCSPRLKGRYMYIQSNLNLDLTICEAQVFGEIL